MFSYNLSKFLTFSLLFEIGVNTVITELLSNLLCNYNIWKRYRLIVKVESLALWIFTTGGRKKPAVEDDVGDIPFWFAFTNLGRSLLNIQNFFVSYSYVLNFLCMWRKFRDSPTSLRNSYIFLKEQMHSSLKHKFVYRLTVVYESKRAKKYSWKIKSSLDYLVQLQFHAYTYLKTRYCSPLLDLSSPLGFASALSQKTEHIGFLLQKIWS